MQRAITRGAFAGKWAQISARYVSCRQGTFHLTLGTSAVEKGARAGMNGVGAGTDDIRAGTLAPSASPLTLRAGTLAPSASTLPLRASTIGLSASINALTAGTLTLHASTFTLRASTIVLRASTNSVRAGTNALRAGTNVCGALTTGFRAVMDGLGAVTKCRRGVADGVCDPTRTLSAGDQVEPGHRSSAKFDFAAGLRRTPAWRSSASRRKAFPECNAGMSRTLSAGKRARKRAAVGDEWTTTRALDTRHPLLSLDTLPPPCRT